MARYRDRDRRDRPDPAAQAGSFGGAGGSFDWQLRRFMRRRADGGTFESQYIPLSCGFMVSVTDTTQLTALREHAEEKSGRVNQALARLQVGLAVFDRPDSAVLLTLQRSKDRWQERSMTWHRPGGVVVAHPIRPTGYGWLDHSPDGCHRPRDGRGGNAAPRQSRRLSPTCRPALWSLTPMNGWPWSTRPTMSLCAGPGHRRRHAFASRPGADPGVDSPHFSMSRGQRWPVLQFSYKV